MYERTELTTLFDSLQNRCRSRRQKSTRVKMAAVRSVALDVVFELVTCTDSPSVPCGTF